MFSVCCCISPSTQAPCPGSFAASQATMSVGNLCFATAVPNTGQWKEPLVVQGAESNITVSIVPTATSGERGRDM